jgi:outer membrane protein assembly factor BamB
MINLSSALQLLVVCLVLAGVARAQRDPLLPAGSGVFLDTDPAASRMLATARDLMAAGHWGDAVDLLRIISDQHGRRLAKIDGARYVNVQTYVDLVLASLPADGLKLYRAKIDPQARRWYESARRLRDEEGLERIVRQAFLSSSGDDALLMLGDLAWERGDLSRARNCWEKLIPLGTPAEPGELPDALRYPDSPIEVALVRSRLILCSLMQGNLAEAKSELAAFQRDFPQATGRIAGRSGNLTEILATQVAGAGKNPMIGRDGSTPTFAGNGERNQVLAAAIDVGRELWSVRLKPIRIERVPKVDEFMLERTERPERRFPSLPQQFLAYYPVIWKNVVFYCDDTDIFAYDLAAARGGKPAWGSDGSIYRLPAELVNQGSAIPRTRVGLQRFTLSIGGSNLYARLGATASTAGKNRGNKPAVNMLVCLDLPRQGDLKWTVRSDELELDGGKWTFDGAPVTAGGRLLVTLRRTDPQLQLNVACFEAASGKLQWNSKVCGGVEVLGGDFDEFRHQLLTVTDERVYCCTNLGAVAALDLRDGAMQWAAIYPRVEADSGGAFNRAQQHGPNPCLVHDGLVLAAPTDSDGILAIDCDSGVLKWSHTFSTPGQQLLGATDGRLVIAGDFLWGLDLATGHVQWREGRSDPEAATCGRGVLAGGLVYWPRREEIRLVEIATGRVRRQIDLRERYGMVGGGNLTIAEGLLLIARSDRLTALSELGGIRKPDLNDLAFRGRRRY